MNKFCMHQTIYCDSKSEYYLFTCSIHNVSAVNNINATSMPFKMTNGCTYEATLCSSKDKITFNIVSTSTKLKCSVSLFIGSKTLLFSNNLKLPTSNSGQGPSFRSYYDLVTLSAKDECFLKMKQHPDDTLILICRIIYSANTSGISPVYMSDNTTTDSLRNLKTLAAALKNSTQSFLNEKVILRVGEETETVSKALLCARSPVFSKMFESDMRELKENIVTVTDIKMPVLKVIVSFLYTGKLSNGDSDMKSSDYFDFICQLYYASDKYDIADLRQLCVDILLPQVSMENVIRVLKLAFSLNDLQLKSTVMAMIAANIDTWIFTDDWKNLVNDEPKIVVDILNFFDF